MNKLVWALPTLGAGGTGITLTGAYALGAFGADDRYAGEIDKSKYGFGENNKSCGSLLFSLPDQFNERGGRIEEEKHLQEIRENGVYDSTYISKEEAKVMPPQDLKVDSSVVGCAMLNQEYYDFRDPVSGGDFHGSVSFRNDSVGGSLRVDGRGDWQIDPEVKVHGFNGGFLYNLFFLVKDENDAWKIVANYGWYDDVEIETKTRLWRVILPAGVDWMADNMDACKTKDESGYVVCNRYYTGIWDSKEDGKGGEVLKGIEIWGQRREVAEILGRQNSFSEGKDEGYRSVNFAYLPGKRKWPEFKLEENPQNGTGPEGIRKTPYSEKLDISGLLDQWYLPFKGKLGEGVDRDSYCAGEGLKLAGACGPKNVD